MILLLEIIVVHYYTWSNLFKNLTLNSTLTGSSLIEKIVFARLIQKYIIKNLYLMCLNNYGAKWAIKKDFRQDALWQRKLLLIHLMSVVQGNFVITFYQDLKYTVKPTLVSSLFSTYSFGNLALDYHGNGESINYTCHQFLSISYWSNSDYWSQKHIQRRKEET